MADPELATELRAAERLRRTGKLDKAADALQAILAKSPANAEIRKKLAEVQLESGNRDGAISQYVKIQEQLANDGDVLGAITAGLKVVELDPKFDNPLAYVAKVKVESLREEQKAKAAQTVAVRPITPLDDIPLLSGPGQGSMLIKLSEDVELIGAIGAMSKRDEKLVMYTPAGKMYERGVDALLSTRGGRGKAIVKRNGFDSMENIIRRGSASK